MTSRSQFSIHDHLVLGQLAKSLSLRAGNDPLAACQMTTRMGSNRTILEDPWRLRRVWFVHFGLDNSHHLH